MTQASWPAAADVGAAVGVNSNWQGRQTLVAEFDREPSEPTAGQFDDECRSAEMRERSAQLAR